VATSDYGRGKKLLDEDVRAEHMLRRVRKGRRPEELGAEHVQKREQSLGIMAGRAAVGVGSPVSRGARARSGQVRTVC
jgi:hypothetical protein